jgi:large subunit ribosomal protein L9
MKVILKQDVEKLGDANDIVNVKPGFGRNYLIPQGMAILATESAQKMHAETLKQRAHKEGKLKSEAESLATKIAAAEIKVGAKAGENGKIFGSVNTIQLSENLKKLGFDIDRKHITIKDEPIKNLGKYKADVKLHKEIIQTIEFEVVEE